MTTIKEFVKIRITDKMKADAQKIGTDTYNNIYRTASYSKFDTSDPSGDNVLGYLGEIVFSYYRYGNWDRVLNRVQDSAKPYDDTIDDKTIEIKTGRRVVDIAKISSNFYFMIAHQQVKNRPDYYVQILIHKDSAYITGYITLEEVLRSGITNSNQNPSFNVPISKLYPIYELIRPDGLTGWAK